jgi:3-hydroxy acid dehydrogenase/malonic semialdehyde reductase
MILITGASSGIGEACARVFAKAGRPLILVARREEKLQALADKIKKEYAIEPHCVALDVQDPQAIEARVKENPELYSQVTVLVNNAGLAKGLGPIQDGKTEDWDTMIDTNIKGLLYMTRAILPFMIKRRSGHIVNLGSVAGYWAYPNGNVYSATKFAVRGLNESMRLDLQGTGVRVTEIAPGMVKTEFSEVRLQNKEKAEAVYAGMEPLNAQDVAEAIEWCVSRPARVNIQELVIYPTDQASTTFVHRQTTK